MEKLYTVEVVFLLTSEHSKDEVSKHLEHALNSACVDLEYNGINPTYKMREIKEI